MSDGVDLTVGERALLSELLVVLEPVVSSDEAVGGADLVDILSFLAEKHALTGEGLQQLVAKLRRRRP